MSTRTLAALMWGTAIALAINTAVLGFGAKSALLLLASWSIALSLVVLWDEWRHPATGWTFSVRTRGE